MAVKATFNVDFESFRSEVEKAIVSFQRFEGETGVVGEQLSAMANKFTGVKVIAEATLMAEAITRIGGVTKLTDAELAKVGATAAAAAEKFTAWGRTVPDSIGALTKYAKQAGDEAATTTGQFTLLTGAVQSLASTVAAAVSVRAMATFALDTVQAARALRSLSYETGLTTTEIQLLNQTSKDYGITADQMARAVDILVKRIAGGEASATSAVHAFGLSLEDLKTTSPLEVLRTMLTHIAGLGTEFEKQHAAAGLFGERMGRIMVRMSGDFDQTYDHLQALNTVLSDETTARLATTADQWDELVRVLKLAGAGTLDTVVSGIGAITAALDKGVTKWGLFKAVVQDTLASTISPGSATALATLIDQANRVPKDIVLPKPPAPVTPLSDEAKLAALLKDDTKELTDLQTHYLDQLYDANLLTKENADIFGVTTVQATRYKKALDDIVAAQAHLATETRDWSNAVNTAMARYITILDALNAKEEKRLDTQTQIVTSLMVQNDLAKTALNARGLGGGTTPTDPVLAAIEKRDQAIKDIESQQREAGPLGLHRDVSASLAQVWADFDDALRKLATETTSAAGGMDRLGTAATSVAAKMTQALGSAPSTTPRWGGDLLPWSPLSARPIDVKPIVAGSYGGVGPVNMNVQISGVFDPRAEAEFTALFTKIIGKARQWQNA